MYPGVCVLVKESLGIGFPKKRLLSSTFEAGDSTFEAGDLKFPSFNNISCDSTLLLFDQYSMLFHFDNSFEHNIARFNQFHVAPNIF